ncbi:primosome, DnaD subunit [Ammonifex degensii KC4]|uniref:Primosome, DnaD subunit n=1 Tax=Ammonifex degensii (strain DSM 10501 / KC4) TaxID=429009 RepID=C9R916_AMMDK|nr:DnaD domain protein [Ammonifex degensii]ACX52795.1 primosome, DnaD subunit [Ammonifex degensii KC4]
MAGKRSRPIKVYREGDLLSAFGTDLLAGHGLFVPSLLLRAYKRIGLSDLGMMIILQLLCLRLEEGKLYARPEELAEYLTAEVEEIASELERLQEKKILGLAEYYVEGQKIIGFDFQPFFEKLAEIWALSRSSELETIQREGKEREEGLDDAEFGQLYSLFEQEFGRPLSPLEAEQILKWRQEMPPELVREALRRAVLIGKRNFKYIGSILSEWRKNNLRTLAEVEEYDRQFEAGRQRRKKKTEKETEGNQDKKRALIKSLYLS